MKTKTGSIGVLGILLLALALVSPGCVSVSAPKSIEIGDGQSKPHTKKADRRDEYEEGRKISKDEAYSIARDKAINKGAQPREYDIRDKKVRGQYWVFFEHGSPREKRTWKNHFVVRVSMYGWSTLYKPSGWSSDVKVRKIDKDGAYDVARRVASREGAKVKGYEIHDKEIDGNYWVVFETQKYRKKAGWKNHFAVRVSRNGEADMYK